MKTFFFAISIIGLISLTSCGAQENCRGRGNYYTISKQQPVKMLGYNNEQEVR